jgi:mRNA interferase MazF
MRRGEIWLADIGRKPRPVLVITRDDVLDVRTNVTVVEISTQARGLAVEVPIDTDTGVHQPSVVNCDGLHTVAQQRLTQRLGSLDDDSLEKICEAAAVALGCDRN